MRAQRASSRLFVASSRHTPNTPSGVRAASGVLSLRLPAVIDHSGSRCERNNSHAARRGSWIERNVSNTIRARRVARSESVSLTGTPV